MTYSLMLDASKFKSRQRQPVRNDPSNGILCRLKIQLLPENKSLEIVCSTMSTYFWMGCEKSPDPFSSGLFTNHVLVLNPQFPRRDVPVHRVPLRQSSPSLCCSFHRTLAVVWSWIQTDICSGSQKALGLQIKLQGME